MDREDDHGEEVKGEEETREKEKGRSGQEENTESGQERRKEGREEKADEGKEGGAEAQSAGKVYPDGCTAACTRPILAACHRRHERWRNGHRTRRQRRR